MISFDTVKRGNISLAEIVGINHFLDMQSDIEYENMNKPIKEGVR